jgi:hypothetical protein
MTMKTLLIAGALTLALVSNVVTKSPTLSQPNASWAKPVVTVR